jgi:hypothetical protein
MSNAQHLTAHDIRRLAVESRRDPRTVRNVIAGRARDLAKLEISEAAERLGIALPTVEARD